MPISYTKLPGLDQDRVLAVIEPVLAAHHVVGVELIWVGDHVGQVLRLSVERPDSKVPGAGITIDLCAEISRDLSAALDVADVIRSQYHLEVGSPGVERALHVIDDYVRFAGQLAKMRLDGPLGGREAGGPRTLRGTLLGLDAEGKISIDTEEGVFSVPFENIQTARLVFEMAQRPKPKPGQGKAPKNSPKTGASKTWKA